MKIRMSEDWREILHSELTSEWFQQLSEFVDNERKNHLVFPPEEHVFQALQNTAFKNTKVVILGQDPYHGFGQAMGLSFSVPRGEKIPPSLKNIYKELQADLGIEKPSHGDLSSWSEQGVLLLNTTLTVRKSEPNSHQKKGWEKLTDKIISHLSEQKQHLVFLLWGSFAHEKSILIDDNKHLVLKSTHPSPLSAHRGFLGCKHFSMCNSYLIENKQEPIDWSL
jgi:uracil-DNA glycosylase